MYCESIYCLNTLYSSIMEENSEKEEKEREREREKRKDEGAKKNKIKNVLLGA